MVDEPSASSGARSDVSASEDGHARRDHESPGEALNDLIRQIAELRSHVRYFIAAKLDGIVVSMRKVGIYAAMGIVGLIALGGMLVTAVVMLLSGLAGAVSAMFETSAWVGDLTVGLLVLALIGGGAGIGWSRLTKKFRQRTVKKYERMRNEQRSEFGHDVHDRAAAR